MMKITAVRCGMLVAALAAATAFAAAAPANAAITSHAGAAITAPLADDTYYPPAYNQFDIWLTGSPNPYMVQACRAVDIYLTAGNYYWLNNLQPGYGKTVYVYLASGTYEWGVCIYPENGYYYEEGNICPLSLGPDYPCVSQSINDEVVNSGTKVVGSELYWESL